MKKFYDTEHDVFVTEETLYNEYIERVQNNDEELEGVTFSDYVRNCMVECNGTLEIVK